jgi:hypothetical protein
MSEPREVLFTLAQSRSLSVLESARALAVAGVRQSDAIRLISSLGRQDANPDDVVRGAELLYALAWQYVKRTEPATTWSDAQEWRVVLDLTTPLDELAEAEAVASVDAAIVTGLPPAIAGELSLAQIEEYRRVADERTRSAGRARRGRRAG